MPMIAVPATPLESDEGLAALLTMRPIFAAIPADDVKVVRVDLPAACDLMLNTHRRLEAYRAALVEQFGEFATTKIDVMPMLALATRQADIEYIATRGVTNLSALADETREAHQLLLTDADSLANRKFIDRQVLEPARSTQGYAALGESTRVLVQFYRSNWAELSPHTPIRLEDVERAQTLALKLGQATRTRDAGHSRADAADLRRRALSYLSEVYLDVRAMVAFVRRRHDDADVIAPSLFSLRTNGHDGDDTDSTDTDADAPVTPSVTVPNNGGGPFIR